MDRGTSNGPELDDLAPQSLDFVTKSNINEKEPPTSLAPSSNLSPTEPPSPVTTVPSGWVDASTPTSNQENDGTATNSTTSTLPDEVDSPGKGPTTTKPTEPTQTEPQSAGPQSIDPQSTEPQSIEPQSTEPQSTELQSTKSPPTESPSECPPTEPQPTERTSTDVQPTSSGPTDPQTTETTPTESAQPEEPQFSDPQDPVLSKTVSEIPNHLVRPGHRVKVYQLQAEGQWADKGTGHLTHKYEGQKLALIVTDEKNHEPLQQHIVNPEEAIEYERQGDTIITWAEGADPTADDPCDSVDIALSFQEPDACEEIHSLITAAQSIMTDDETSSRCSDVDMLDPAAIIPFPSVNNLREFADCVVKVGIHEKEAASARILETNMIGKLVDLFKMAEDLENMPDLATLFTCFKSIMLWNDQKILDHLFHEENIMDLIAALEYDPDIRKKRFAENHDIPIVTRKHRDYINNAHKIQILDFPDDLSRTIKQTFILTYLRDVILIRYSDDPTQNSVSQFIQFNEMNIVHTVMHNHVFLANLFNLMQGKPTQQRSERHDSDGRPSTPVLEKHNSGGLTPSLSLDSTSSDDSFIGPSQTPEPQPDEVPQVSEPKSLEDRKNAFLFFRELITISKRLTLKKGELYECLVTTDLMMETLENVCFEARDVIQYHWLWMILADPLFELMTHKPHSFRLRCVEQANSSDPNAKYLSDILVSAMCTSSTEFDTGLMYQLSTIIFKSLELTQDPLVEPGSRESVPVLASYHGYWDYFFETQVQTLVNGLCCDGDSLVVRDMKFHCMEILTHCLKDGKNHGKMFRWNEAMDGVNQLIKSVDRRLVLSAIRFLRACVGAKEQQFNDLIIRKRMFDNLIDVFVSNGDRANLLNSVVLELFDYIRKENEKDLIAYMCSNKNFQLLKCVTYVRLFAQIFLRHEQNMDMDQGADIVNTPRFIGDVPQSNGQDWDAPDDAYFNDDSDDEVKYSDSSEAVGSVEPDDSSFVERKKATEEEEYSLVNNLKQALRPSLKRKATIKISIAPIKTGLTTSSAVSDHSTSTTESSEAPIASDPPDSTSSGSGSSGSSSSGSISTRSDSPMPGRHGHMNGLNFHSSSSAVEFTQGPILFPQLDSLADGVSKSGVPLEAGGSPAKKQRGSR